MPAPALKTYSFLHWHLKRYMNKVMVNRKKQLAIIKKFIEWLTPNSLLSRTNIEIIPNNINNNPPPAESHAIHVKSVFIGICLG